MLFFDTSTLALPFFFFSTWASFHSFFEIIYTKGWGTCLYCHILYMSNFNHQRDEINSMLTSVWSISCSRRFVAFRKVFSTWLFLFSSFIRYLCWLFSSLAWSLSLLSSPRSFAILILTLWLHRVGLPHASLTSDYFKAQSSVPQRC